MAQPLFKANNRGRARFATSFFDATLTASAQGVTAGTVSASKGVVVGTNKEIDTLVIANGGLKLGSGAGTAVGATAAELNIAADISSFTLELTATAVVPATARVVELNHASVVIAATYTVVANTMFIIKDTSATGTAAHTVTLTGGTFNGTNTIATLNARDELLMVWFDSTGRGSVILNLNSVALS